MGLPRKLPRRIELPGLRLINTEVDTITTSDPAENERAEPEVHIVMDSAHQIESLAGLTRKEFRALWLEYFGQDLKNPSRRDTLVRILAYKLQENIYGGLTALTIKRLRKLGAELEANPAAKVVEVPDIKPGTRLIREWRSERYTVTATESGFAYAGRQYESLSEIVRLITGSRRSGPLFFGLRVNSGKQKDKPRAS
jgi:hypothetical protein